MIYNNIIDYKEVTKKYKLKESSDESESSENKEKNLNEKLEEETFKQKDIIDNDNIKKLKEQQEEKNNIPTNKDNKKLVILEENIKKLDEETIIFNGKEFKNYKRNNNYKRKDNIDIIIYKCINYRHKEKFRNTLKMKKFCRATIIYIFPTKKKKGKYKLKYNVMIYILKTILKQKKR